MTSFHQTEIAPGQTPVSVRPKGPQLFGWRVWLFCWLALFLLFAVQPVLKLAYGPDELSFDLENRVKHGFSRPEEDASGARFTWTEGATAYVLLDYFTSKPLILTVEVRSAVPFGGPDEPVHLLANGQEIALLRPDPNSSDFQTTTLKFVPPPSPQSQLRLDMLAVPFTLGDRTVGVAVRSVSIDKTEAWSTVSRRFVLYWIATLLLALLPVVRILALRTKSPIFGYLFVAMCAAGAFCMLLALFFIVRMGVLDWATTPMWFVCSLYLLAAFVAATLLMPLGAPSHPSIGATVHQWAVSRRLPLVTPNSPSYIWLTEMQGRLARFWAETTEPRNIWFGFRVALLFLPIINEQLYHHYVGDPGRPIGPDTWMERFIWPWTRWDGGPYLRIASTGYEGDPMLGAWYPFYPVVIRLFSLPFTLGDNSPAPLALSGILVSTMATLAVCLLLYKLVLHECGRDRDVARLSVLYLMAFPTAFFLFSVYTESLFLAMVLGAFLAARSGRWPLALLLAALTAVTKNQGIFVSVALLVEYAHQRNWRISSIDRKILWFSLPIAAFGGWLAFNLAFYGNAFRFARLQSEIWGRQFSWPWEGIIASITLYFEPKETGTWLPLPPNSQFYEVPLTTLFIALGVVLVWLSIRKLIRPSYVVFFWGCLLLPLTSGGSRGFELYGMSRYLLILFPAFLVLALAGKRSPAFHYFYIVLSIALLAIFFSKFSLWYWLA